MEVHICSFPEEVLLEIFAFCGDNAVFELGKVCQLFRRLALDRRLTVLFDHERRRKSVDERRWFFLMTRRVRIFAMPPLGSMSAKEKREPKEYVCSGNKVDDLRKAMSRDHMIAPHNLSICYFEGSKKLRPQPSEVLRKEKAYHGVNETQLDTGKW